MKLILRVFAICLVPLLSLGAQVTALKPGQVKIVTSYLNANGLLVADSLVLTVLPPAVALVNLFNQVNPPRWVNAVPVGKTFCAYAQAKDAQGNVLTGRAIKWASSDTTVARIAPNVACPDTSVDITKILVNPFPPG